ncbi:MAG TPA: hypothetical protein VM262_17455 [Acidimicrobiales bacterium]|nr:hypothetical protein [Acidimicrobiales bacterium]
MLVRTASGPDLEQVVAREFETLLDRFDLSPWRFTETMLLPARRERFLPDRSPARPDGTGRYAALHQQWTL